MTTTKTKKAVKMVNITFKSKESLRAKFNRAVIKNGTTAKEAFNEFMTRYLRMQ